MHMKHVSYLVAALAVAFLLAGASSSFSQVDKVLEKTKDLKKKVEGGQTTSTNKPAQKTPPTPPAPQKPSR